MNFPLSDEHRQQVITVLLLWWTCWGKSSGGQQGCDSRCDVKLMNSLRRSFLLPDEHFSSGVSPGVMNGVRGSFLFQMKHFSSKQFWLLTKQDVMTSAIAAETFSSSVHHLSNRQPDQWRDDESSSFVLLKFSTSKLQLKFCLLCRDWQHLCVNCDILYNIVNCAFTVLLYCYCNAIVTSVCPSISEEHYQILSICRELGFFF